jgi:ABC-type antimicrobial peptide transport system ATPase subunit
MDKFSQSMAVLVDKYTKVYTERQLLMKQTRRFQVVNTEERYPTTYQPWYLAMQKDNIVVDCRINRHFFTKMASMHGGQVQTVDTQWFTSQKAKTRAIAHELFCLEQFKDSANSHPWYSKETVEKRIAELEATPVHPYAKQLLQYRKMVRRMKSLDRQKSELRSAIKALNKLRFGVEVVFGNDSHYAMDRITAVRTTDRSYKPAEFINHVAFESLVLAAG